MEPKSEQPEATTPNQGVTIFGALIGAAAAVPN